MAVNASWLEMVALLLVGGRILGTGEVTPLPEDPVVAQIAPPECLIYSSWTGNTSASPDATSSTEQLFSNPKFRAFVERAGHLLHETISKSAGSQANRELQIEAAFQFFQHLHARPGAWYISEIKARGNQFPKISGGLMLRVEDDEVDPIVEIIESLLKQIPPESRSTELIGNSPFSRVELAELGPPITWGIRDNYLVVGIGAGEAKRIAERQRGSITKWLADAKKAIETPRPASFVHLDIRRLVDTIRAFLGPQDAAVFAGVLQAFGLDAMESFSYGSGLDDEGIVSRGLLKLPGELRGMMRLVDCEPLVAADFKRISSESPLALVFQLSLADAWTAFLDSCGHEAAPQDASDLAGHLRSQLQAIDGALGINIRNDLFASIGDTCEFSPSQDRRRGRAAGRSRSTLRTKPNS